MQIQSKNAIPGAWNIPFYRSTAVSLFLSGMGVSAAQPLLTLFFVTHLDVSPSVASLYFLTALAGPPISILTGRLSDRLPGRMPLIRASALWVPIGWIMLSLTQHMWMVFAIGVIWSSLGPRSTLGRLPQFATISSTGAYHIIIASCRISGWHMRWDGWSVRFSAAGSVSRSGCVPSSWQPPSSTC